jgi:hypothetical protein
VIQRARQSPGGTDPYGDPIPGTETLEEIPAPSGFAQSFTAPRISNDIDGPGRAGVIVGLTLYFECGYDLNHDDHVIVDGVRYRVEGEPGDWQHPKTGWDAGAEVALVRAEG